MIDRDTNQKEGLSHELPVPFLHYFRVLLHQTSAFMTGVRHFTLTGRFG